MRDAMLTMTAVLAACSMGACSMAGGDDDGPGAAASGSGSTRSYAIADFTGVELKGSDDVDVRVGTGFSVRAEGPSEELDKLRIDKDGATLRVGRRKGMDWGRHARVRVFVTMPRIAAATIAGSGDMRVDRADGASLAGTIAGSGNLSFGALSVESAKLSIAGSGDLTAAGTARAMSVDLAGSGNVDAGGLKAREAAVSIAGAGDVKAVVDGPAKVTILGSGDVDLGPGAKCSVTKMGSGTVTCG